jgi:hypothetical protein
MLKWLIKKQLEAFGRKWHYDTGYMKEIVDEAGARAVMPLNALQKLKYRQNVPLDTYYAATLTAAQHADCGPCLQLGVSMAEAAGVAPQTIRAILERDYQKLSKDTMLGVELALGTIARDTSGDEARAEILKRWGRKAVVSLAYGIVAAQAYPTFKYAIGAAHACVRLRIGNENVAIERPQYA